MHKILAFTERNIKELLRDPLSYIFCLGFPLIMLIVMTLVDQSIPAEAGMTIFHIDNLSGGIAIFGQTFIMLFTTLTLTKDRSGSFLVRMYATPMRSSDFIWGYMLPVLVIALLQAAVAFVVSGLIALITGTALSILGLLLAVVALIPSAVFFIGLGLLFGTIFNEKSAPGMCSIIISLGSFLGCIWFDAESTGGVLLSICKALPFYYCTKVVRSAIHLSFTWEGFFLPLMVVCACAILMTLAASFAFRKRMRADLS